MPVALMFSTLLALELSSTPTCSPMIAAAAPTAGEPWVQLVNPCDEPIELDEFVLRYTGASFAFGATDLAGVLEPGACTVVRDFDPPLQAGQTCADAIGVFDFTADALRDDPLDVVAYGGEACEAFADPVDLPFSPRPWQRMQLGEAGWEIVTGSEPPSCDPRPADLPLAIPNPAAECLWIEEVMYKPGTSAGQWVDVVNTCAVEIDLDGLSLNWTAPIYDWFWGVRKLDGRTLAPGACMTVSADPEMTAPDGAAEGVGIFTYGVSTPHSVMVYGEENKRMLIGPDGLPAPVDIADVPAGWSILSAGDGWVASPSPAPCQAFRSDQYPGDANAYGCFYDEPIDPLQPTAKDCAMLMAKCADMQVEHCDDDPKACVGALELCWAHVSGTCFGRL